MADLGAFCGAKYVLLDSANMVGGPTENRTRVQGFAVLCVTTPPSGLIVAVEARSSRYCLAWQLAIGNVADCGAQSTTYSKSCCLPLKIGRSSESRLAFWCRLARTNFKVLYCDCNTAVPQGREVIRKHPMESVDFDNMRRGMVDSQLRTSGVNTPWVIAAMASVPRENFVPAPLRSTAYMDRALPLGEGRTLNPPVATALMLQAAELSADDNVLLIGQPQGYVAALLASRARNVIGVENLAGLGVIHRKGPFSLIIIDGAVEELPDSLLGLATENARIVTGIVERGVTRVATGLVRSGKVALRPFADTEVAVLPEFAAPKEFAF